MREKPRDTGRLRHILHAIDNIGRFMSGHTPDDFGADTLLYYGVVKNLEIISEAAYMLTKEFQDAHPETPWRQIIGMRHFLVHGYYQVDSSEVWITATRDLSPLREQIERYLSETDTSLDDPL